jgi:hypothetical protein
MHQTALQLVWADGESFAIEDKPELDDDTIAEKIVIAIAANPGVGWAKVEKETPGVRGERRRQVRDRLLRDGVVVNVVKDENGVEVALDHCPGRRPAHLHPADDPTIRHLRPDPDADGTQFASAGGEGASESLRPASRPYRDAGSRDADAHPLEVDDDEVDRLYDRRAEWGIE